MKGKATLAFVLLGILLIAAPVLAAPQVTVSGTNRVTLWGTGTQNAVWHTNVSGGVPPYQYQWLWNGYPVSNATGANFGGTYYGPGSNMSWTDVVSVVVTDSTGASGSDAHNISVTCYEQGSGRD